MFAFLTRLLLLEKYRLDIPKKSGGWKLTSEAKKKADPARSWDGEGLFTVWLVLFAVLEIVLSVCIFAQTFKSGSEPSLPPPATDPAVTDENEPSAELPVFAVSPIPAKPTETDRTETLSAIKSKYAVLINAETGEILAQKSSDVSFSPASMTKIMTLIVACENLTETDLQQKIPLTEEVVSYTSSGNYKGTEFALPRESNGYTCIGDRYTVRDLLYGIGIQSAADCTYMVVRTICDSEDAFVELMNRKAAELGLTDTHFDNAVGFDSPTNVTTARDMAVILSYAMQCDLIADILQPREARYSVNAYYTDATGAEKTYQVFFTPSLKSRTDKYDPKLTSSVLTATKTGYTTGSFLAVAATGKNDRTLYILILGDGENESATLTQKFTDTMQDLEWILNTYIP